jgi:branched-chain amino acid aminotransferase
MNTFSTLYINGGYVSKEEPQIYVNDIGFLRGYSVFDVMPVFNGVPFLHKEHWERLEKSAWELGLHLPLGREDHTHVIQMLLKENNATTLREVIVRTLLSGGVSDSSFHLEKKETFCVMLEAFHQFPMNVYEKGVRVVTLEYERSFPKAKTTNYITPIRFYATHKNAEKIFEIVYVSQGEVLEASTSNITFVKNGALYSPYDGVLEGITRLLILRLARKLGLSIYGQDVSIEEMYEADEVFLTASNKGVVPVVQIDENVIADGSPGEVTQKLMSEYETYRRSYGTEKSQ